MAGVVTEPVSDGTHPEKRDRSAHKALRNLVVVAHRGPFRFAEDSGRYRIERNSGGLVTALRDVARSVDETTWFCAAASDADRLLARQAPWLRVAIGDRSCRVGMVEVDPGAHHDFYAVISNPLLWFVQHYLWDHTTMPAITRREHDAWEHGYMAVNRQFADAIAEPAEVPQGSLVMVHDYHFYLVPEMLRRRRPDLFLHFFVHIPWPQPDAWRVLPGSWRDAVFRGLLGSDIVGFHTERYIRNFLHGCEDLLGLDVDYRHASVRVDGREVAVRHYPISVDESTLRELACTPEASEHETDLARRHTEQLVLRVDRTDPSKNIVRGFQAFDRMLETHPEHQGRVTFLALLQPSRQDVPEYADYLRAIESTVHAVNARWRRSGWTPIDLRIGDNLPLTVAAYKRFDVLMVNAVFDGMNLVAKEALVVNERQGVLALSENTGAYEELGAVAVTLHPFDIEQQAEALHDALTMPAAARANRHAAGVDIVRTNNVQKWLQRQMFDIELMRGPRALTM